MEKFWIIVVLMFSLTHQIIQRRVNLLTIMGDAPQRSAKDDDDAVLIEWCGKVRAGGEDGAGWRLGFHKEERTR